MRKALGWLTAVTVLTMLVPATASAQNFYVGIRGGPGFAQDTQQGPPGHQEPLDFNTGFTGSAAVGYKFPFGLRFEGEIGFIYSPVKSDGGVNVDGSIKNYLGMANIYYDLPLGKLKPYVGFGIGAARVNDDHQLFAEPLNVKFESSEWRTAFAYQARAGVLYDVNQWLDLSLGYRYVHIDGGHYDVGPTKFRLDAGSQTNHSVELGFAIKF